MTKPSGELSSWEDRFNKFLAFPEDNILDGFATEEIKKFIATEINRAKREAEIALTQKAVKIADKYGFIAADELQDELDQIINQSEGK